MVWVSWQHCCFFVASLIWASVVTAAELYGAGWKLLITFLLLLLLS